MAGNARNKKNNTSERQKAGRPKKNNSVRTLSADKGRGSYPKANDNKDMIKTEVILIGLFAFSVLLFLSNFHLCGIAGEYLRGIQLGLFGTLGFLVPVFLFAGTCFYMSNQGSLLAKIKFFAMLGGFITICGCLQLLFGDMKSGGQGVLFYYHSSATTGAGGGLVGGILVSMLIAMVGTVGTYVILTVLLLICIVCITEKSVVSVVRREGGRAYHYAKDDIEKRRVLHEQKRDEKRLQKENQKVSGVNLQSTAIRAYPHLNQEAVVSETTAEILERPQNEAYSADVFSGNIELPRSYQEDGYRAFQMDAETPLGFVQEDEFADVIHPIENESAYFRADDLNSKEDFDRLFSAQGMNSIEEMSGINEANEFVVPEETKKVITASGKIIETDTEMLQKKLEERREEQKAEQAPSIAVDKVKKIPPVKRKDYRFPPMTLLSKGEQKTNSFSEQEYRETAIKLQKTLQNFGVGVTVTNISCGPSVTRYELHPEQGVKVSKIVGLTDDIKLSLAASDIRIEAPIPGKSAVGIEVPNKSNTTVSFRELLEVQEFQNGESKLSFAVGKDIAGQVVVADIAKMPHLLIAGATGSGKSVCINTLIMSLIFKAHPDDVKMIMIDPKVVELSVYNGIPHLLIPVVTDPKKASGALNWAVAEMTDRYQKFAQYNVRDLKGYNKKIENIQGIEDDEKPQKLPQIVIIVDELADLMMVAPGEVEDAICRLAQLARAAGIHLVIATQRPSVNVITGLIKANVPSRIAFSVSSGVDSRTIIDMNGAEKLLGKGDMLFYPAGYQKPQRVQGAFISDHDVSKVVEFLLKQEVVTEYQPDIESRMQSPTMEATDHKSDQDEYFLQAGKFVIEKEKASIGMLQRVFKIGFNRAARIMDQLAEVGVVGEEEGTKPRKVLMTIEEFDSFMNQK